ncbi:hypothetical protein BJX99DRAFT_242834 [Aspergillus californicus]
MPSPPGSGNDLPRPDSTYVIGGHDNSGLVFTAHGDNVRLNSYEQNQKNQEWLCCLGPEGFGFVNKETGKYLSLNDDYGVNDWANEQGKWESFIFQPLETGGFTMIVLYGKCYNYYLEQADTGENYVRAQYDLRKASWPVGLYRV